MGLASPETYRIFLVYALCLCVCLWAARGNMRFGANSNGHLNKLHSYF